MASLNTFADLVGMTFEVVLPGESTMRLQVDPRHLNPNAVVHGAVLYAMADTGMGAALYRTLNSGEMCATIEIKMTYFKAIASGELVCRTTLVNRGKRVAYLESSIYSQEAHVAKATGTYAIFRPSTSAA
jgi:acyl-CoA thioesterase